MGTESLLEPVSRAVEELQAPVVIRGTAASSGYQMNCKLEWLLEGLQPRVVIRGTAASSAY